MNGGLGCLISLLFMGGFYVEHCDVTHAGKRLPNRHSCLLMCMFCEPKALDVTKDLECSLLCGTTYTQESTMNMNHNMFFWSCFVHILCLRILYLMKAFELVVTVHRKNVG